MQKASQAVTHLAKWPLIFGGKVRGVDGLSALLVFIVNELYFIVSGWHAKCASWCETPLPPLNMTPVQSARPLFNLKDLLCEQLRDLHDAEKQYGSQLPEMMAKATSSHLKDKLREVSDRVLSNSQEVAHACEILGVPPQGVTCEAMKGLIREAKDTSSDWGDSATLDASLISNAQRIAHYEIAGFGTARAFARCLKLGEVAEILQHLLEQAFQDDKDLSYIANGGWFTPGINHEAAEPAIKPLNTPGSEVPSAAGTSVDAS